MAPQLRQDELHATTPLRELQHSAVRNRGYGLDTPRRSNRDPNAAYGNDVLNHVERLPPTLRNIV